MNINLNDDIYLTPLRQLPVVAIAAVNNPIAKRHKTISLKTLSQYDLVSYESADQQPRLFFPPSAKQIIQDNIKYHVTSTNLFYGLLEQQNCFALSLYNEHITDRLIQIPLEDNISITTYLAYHKDALRSFPIKMFLNQVLTFYNKPLLLLK